MQNMDCVYKNGFRKVKLRETENGLFTAPCLTHKHNSFGWSRSLFSPTSAWSWMGKEGYAAAQDTWKWNSEFYKKEEFEENSIHSFKPIENMKLRGTE